MKKSLLLFLLPLLAACGDGGKKAPPGGPGAAMPPAEVDVITVAMASAIISQDLPGRVQAVRSA